MDRSIVWRAALLQAVLVAVVAVVLAAALPRSFFEDWGWLAGPGAWGRARWSSRAVLRLPPLGVLVGAALSGLPMLPGVVVGVHWLGAPLALSAVRRLVRRLAARRHDPVARLMDLGLRGPRRAGHRRVEGHRPRRSPPALVAEGARVAIASRSRERIAGGRAEIGARGYVFDSGDLDAVARR